MVAALVLDFDGLILDTETPLVEAWSAVHTRAGLEFDRRLGQQIIGHSGKVFDPWAAFPPETDRAQLEAEFAARKDDLIAAQSILPGVIALLDHAAATGLPVGVASNSSHRHVDGHLSRLGLADRISVTVCRDDVVHPKPSPDVYARACTLLGTAPAATLAFEDSVPGHLAAHAAGLSVVVVPNPSTAHCEFPHAAIRLASLAELAPAELLARIAG